MVKRLLLIDVGPGETRIALVEDGRLAELSIVRPPADEAFEGARVGEIILGRVKRVLPGMDAAFVDIGEARDGFLSARHAQKGAVANAAPPGIARLVHEGQSLIVQIIKDPLGEKGAGLSLCVSLPGRCLILLPGQATRALSRRIADAADRERLMPMLERIADAESTRAGAALGLIARTAAAEASQDELAAEAADLVRRWQSIKDAAARQSPPARLAPALPALSAVLRDHGSNETEAVIVNDAARFAAMREDAARLWPGLAPRLTLHREPPALFEAYGIGDEIAALESPRALLPSGGWITVEATEALTAIDVNSGRYAGSAPEETGFVTNLEAAREIGRQLRLRGIGGLIIVDFIHMAEAAHIAAVEESLRAALARDRVPARMTPLSEFGVVEITRKRVREPLDLALHQPCACCQGRGVTASAGVIAGAALRELDAQSRQKPQGRALRLSLSPDAAAWLAARQETVLTPLAERLVRPLTVAADPGLARGHYRIEEVAHD